MRLEGPNVPTEIACDDVNYLKKCPFEQEGLWEEAELLRNRELDLKRALSSPSSDTLGVAPPMPTVQASDVADVVAAWTGVPVSQLSQDDCWKLLNLASNLKVSVCHSQKSRSQQSDMQKFWLRLRS